MNNTNQISFIGIQFPLSNSLYGYFTPSYDSYQHLKSKIINLLLTNSGERIIGQNLQFGTKLRFLLFQPRTQEYEGRIISHIKQRITRFIPEVEIINIDIRFDELQYSIIITLKFKLKNDLSGLGQDLILTYALSE